MGCVNIQCLLQCSMKRGEWMGWRKGEGKFPERGTRSPVGIRELSTQQLFSRKTNLDDFVAAQYCDFALQTALQMCEARG